MDIQASETETPAATLQYNVTGTRIIAALIDIVILVALFALMAVVFGDARHSR